MKTQAYCVKCKAKKPMAGAVESVLKNGRKAIKGKCPTCGTGMFKILGASQAKSARTAAPRTETPQTPAPKPPFRFTFFQECD